MLTTRVKHNEIWFIYCPHTALHTKKNSNKLIGWILKYQDFNESAEKIRNEYLSFLQDCKSKGLSVCAYGAAAKGNTLLNYFKLDQDAISYLTDSSILKIGKIAPGSMIPILDDSDIDSDVTHLLILPWNLAEYLKSKLTHLGKEFIIPEITEKYTIKGDDL